MVVVTLTDCPARLRGDITRWMLEISTGVYVGNFSVRVREELWKRICDHIRTGRAVMIYSTAGEQRFGFYVHNSHWVPEDYDGVKLICHLSRNLHNNAEEGKRQKVMSSASRQRLIRKQQMGNPSAGHLENYIVLDFETTGLDEQVDNIIEIGALRIRNDNVVEEFHRLVNPGYSVPLEISKLTGLTDDLLRQEGIAIETALPALIDFIRDSKVICHNKVFEQAFLRAACKRCSLQVPVNHFIDTRYIAKKKLPDARNYKLHTIAEALSISHKGMHRVINDCYVTLEVFKKLNKIE